MTIGIQRQRAVALPTLIYSRQRASLRFIFPFWCSARRMCQLSFLASPWSLHRPRPPHFMIGWSRVSPRHLSARCFTRWCSIGIFRHLSRRDSDNRFSYKPQFFVRAISKGVPPFLIAMPHEWFSSACAYAARPVLGRSVIHTGSLQVQHLLNAGGHAPPEWATPPDWLFEVLTKQLVIPGRRLNRQQLAKMDFPAPSS